MTHFREKNFRENNFSEIRELRILSAIGIILVVAGHLGYNLFDIGGLFPYYSFHVFIFLFVSGYFYRREAEERIGRYLIGKCVTLLLPYFVWNLFYGILSNLLHGAGFSIGETLSLRGLFLSPFLDGHQFMYNFPAWFVPV
nr:acyltransferase family protein [Lachnospiraceae bacterium]